jgi:hypothetical protein
MWQQKEIKRSHIIYRIGEGIYFGLYSLPFNVSSDDIFYFFADHKNVIFNLNLQEQRDFINIPFLSVTSNNEADRTE